MKNIVKVKVILLVISIIFSNNAIASDRILPLPKPSVDQETKKKIIKKKRIYPQKKPNINEQAEKAVISDTDKQEDNVQSAIYPKKKPLVVKKKIEPNLKKSSNLSKRNFNLAKEIFKAIDKKKWQTALALSKIP